MPMGPQMLEDVDEPMPARLATLRDPGAPDQIVMEQHNLRHLPNQPWCKMCVESRGHDSPHREQSKKIDAVVPQPQFDYGYMGDGALCRQRASSCEQIPLLEPSTRRWCQNPRRWKFPSLSQQQPSGCVTFVYMETRERVLQLLLDQVAEECRSERQDWHGRFCDKCHRHRAIRAMEQRRKPSPQHVDLLEHIWQGSKKSKIPSFAMTTHSQMIPWTTRHAAWILTRYNVRRDTRMIPYEKIRGQKYRKEIRPLEKQVLARHPGANVNQLMQPWVTSLWLGRDTLSDEHLIGTAAGVMRSRAVRRVQEPARSVPAALNAMLFTPWSPHLNLPGRPRLPRSTFEEPIEAGTLSGFIEIPTEPIKNPKSETATSTPDDTRQSTKRRRQEVTVQEPLPTSSSAGAAAGTATDSSMVIPGPQIPKTSTSVISRREREDSIQKRHRPTEVNTVLALAGGGSRIEILTLTKDQKSTTHRESQRTSKQILSTRWVSKQRLDGSYKVRLVARGFEQTVSSDTDFYAGTPKLTTVRALFTIAAIHGNPVALGDCQSAFHQPPMPIESEPVHVEPAPEAQVDSFQGIALQESFSRTQDLSPSLWYSHRKSTT